MENQPTQSGGQIPALVSSDLLGEARAKALADLDLAVERLVEIVEGVRSQRWVGDLGGRLKDTHEWCALYVVRCNLRRIAEETWKAKTLQEKNDALYAEFSSTPNAEMRNAPIQAEK